jgi:hypothetical protein
VSTSRPGRRGRFAVFADEPPNAAQLRLPEAGRLVFSLTLKGVAGRIDATGWPCPRLARTFNEVLVREATGKDLSWHSVKSIRTSLARFVRMIARVVGADADVADLEAFHVDLFEKELLAEGQAAPHTGPRRTDGSGNAAVKISHVVRVLRLLHDADPAGFDAELAERIKYTTVASRRATKPVDAYPPAVFEAIKNAATADIRAIQRRILAGEELTTTGSDPRRKMPGQRGRMISGWNHVNNVLWFIDTFGPVGVDVIGATLRSKAKLGGLQDLHARIYLTVTDVVPFLVLLICLTGLEPECAKTLRRDCLSSPARGYVSLRYVKRRSGGSEAVETMRIADGGGLHHPGGLIRLALRLTERARRHTGWDTLWVTYGYRGLARPFHGVNSGHARTQIEEWQRRHGLDKLTDTSGEPVRLDLRRLRKTYKSQQYLKATGILADFAQGHSARVAASHYADIPIHDDVHDQAVQAGLREALAAALPHPTVVDDDGTVLSNPEGEELPPATVDAALSGESDVFLASCRDFHDTPFASKGRPCPVPLWGCVECPNAVFTTRHLPQLLTFLDFIETQREELPAGEWIARYATAWERIVHGVRDKFRPDQITTARAIAEADRARLILPPQFFEGIA